MKWVQCEDSRFVEYLQNRQNDEDFFGSIFKLNNGTRAYSRKAFLGNFLTVESAKAAVERLANMHTDNATQMYKARIWATAVRDAEDAVVRLTPTLVGGRRKDEGLIEYVERGKLALEVALTNWRVAQAEYENATTSLKE